jgi:CheY-like chemotaxis protein
VRDPGIGIAPDVLPRIFDLFVQADQTLARSKGGLGVGLTLVRRLVEMHGGTITASSPGLGEGTEFTIRLPIVAAELHPQTAAPAAGEPGQTTVPRRRVLVVDDNVDAAETIARLVKIWGHDVQTAHNGPAALDAVHRFHPDLVLLDIGLPGMSGYEVARQIRAQSEFRELVLAALTGYGQDEDRRRADEAGFNFHLTKPADPKRLEALVRNPQLAAQVDPKSVC